MARNSIQCIMLQLGIEETLARLAVTTFTSGGNCRAAKSGLSKLERVDAIRALHWRASTGVCAVNVTLGQGQSGQVHMLPHTKPRICC
jgi:hypothetical protein